jgi:integrase
MVGAFVRAHHDHQELNASPDCVFGTLADFERGLEQSLDRIGYLSFAVTDCLMISGRLRSRELVDLRWEQVDFASATLHVRRIKQGTPATHPIIGDELRAAGAAYELDKLRPGR